MNTPSGERVWGEWQFNQDRLFPSESPSLGPSTGRWLCQGEGDGGLRVEAVSAGIWWSEREPFLNISEAGSLERMAMAMWAAGMHAAIDVTPGASVVST